METNGVTQRFHNQTTNKDEEEKIGKETDGCNQLPANQKSSKTSTWPLEMKRKELTALASLIPSCHWELL